MSRKVKKSLNKTTSLILVTAMLLFFAVVPPGTVDAQSFTESIRGFKVDKSGLGWTTGNLGKDWVEGEWVPYQVTLKNIQGAYPNLAGMPDIVVSYDFTNKDNRFVDLVRSIQAGTAELTDAQGWPQSDGTAYPMGTTAQIKAAQNSVGEHAWSGFTLLGLPNEQVHRALSGGLGTPTDSVRKFVIKPADLIAKGLGEEDTIVIYFQLHVSRTFIWENSLQHHYNQSPTDDWGGYVYGSEPFSSDQRLGSSFVPGSSGHAQLEISGKKTVPIPIPQGLPGSISGQKWLDENRDGVKDAGEDRLSGWRIYVSGRVEGIPIGFSTLTDDSGNYSFPNLTSGTTWRVSEASQREVPAEDGYIQTYPFDGASVGQATAISHSKNSQAGWAWDVNLTETHQNQANVDFGNFKADPALTITKDADTEVSKVGDTINYTFVITNTGNVELNRVSVSDTVIGDLTSEFPLTLDPAQSETVTVPYEVKAGDPDPLVNVITATYQVEDDQAWQVSASADHSMDLVVPNIELTKTVSPEIAMVGDEVTYTIKIENTGDWGLENIVVTDDKYPLPAGAFPATLAVGAEAEYSFDYVIQAGDVVGGKVVNTADVHSNPVGLPNDIEDEDSAEVTVVAPALEITKEADNYVSKVGDDIEYTIVVSNTGDVDLEVVVDDSLEGELFDGTIAAQESETFTYTYTVQAGDPDPLVNTATATGYYEPLEYTIEVDASTSTPLVGPGIKLTKSVTPDTAMLGDTVTYTIKIENIGDWGLENIVVTDNLFPLPAGAFPSTLAVSADAEYSFDYEVLAEDVVGGKVVNTASVYSNPVNLPNDIEDWDSAEVTVVAPGLEITKEADNYVSKVGDDIEYTVEVTNTGDVELYVEVTDSLVGGLFFGFIDAGASETFTYTYTVPQGAPNPLVNTATATGYSAVLDHTIEVDASTSTPLVVPGIELTKSVTPDTAMVGDTVTFTIKIENTGDWGLENIVVTDDMFTLPADAFPATLAIGADAEYSFDYEVLAEDVVDGQVVNTASVYSNPVDLPNDIEDEDSAEITVVGPNLTITKEADNYVSKVGDDIVYTIVVANTGDVDLEVVVDDSLEGELFDGVIEAGESETFTYTYTVQAGDPDPLVNTVTATGYYEVLDHTIEVEASTSTPLVVPGIELTKTVSPEVARVGDTVTFTIHLENTGDWDLVNVVVTDDMFTFPADAFPATLDKNDTAEYSFDYIVQEGDVNDEGKVVNIASVHSNPVDLPNDIEDWDSAEVTVVAPALEITKEADNYVSKVGDDIEYTVVVTNTGDVNLSVAVDDSLVGGLFIGVIDAGESATFTYTYTVPEGAPNPLVNTATATGYYAVLDYTIEVEASTSTPLVVPGIELTKTVSPEFAMVGDTVTFTIRIENTGDWGLENIVVTDDMFTFPADAFPATLAVGADAEYSFDYEVLAEDVVDGKVVNTASVYSNPVDLPNDIEDEDAAELFVVIPDIQITKTVSPTSTAVGSEVIYTIRVTNTGNWALENLVVTDERLGGDITAAFGFGDTLGAGDWIEADFPYIIKEGDIVDDAVVNTASVHANPVEFPDVDVEDEDDAIVFVDVNPAISVTKTPDVTCALVGDVITYTYVVTNTGDVTLTDVTAVDTPLGPIALGETTLAPGESTTGTLTKTVAAADLPGPIENTVVATGYYKGNPVQDDDDAIVNTPAIRVTKDAEAGEAGLIVGSDVTYFFEVTNIGSVPLTGVSAVDDPLGPITLDKTTLAPGESTRGTLTYTTVLEDYPTKRNTVEAEGYYGDCKVTDSATLIIMLELPGTGTVIIRKALEGGDALKPEDDDVKFTIEVRDSNDEVVMLQEISVSGGPMALELEEGIYTIREINIPQGFTLVGITGLDSDGKIEVTSDSSHSLVVTNRKETHPPTGGSLGLLGLGTLLGLGGLLFLKKRRKDEEQQ